MGTVTVILLVALAGLTAANAAKRRHLLGSSFAYVWLQNAVAAAVFYLVLFSLQWLAGAAFGASLPFWSPWTLAALDLLFLALLLDDVRGE